MTTEQTAAKVKEILRSFDTFAYGDTWDEVEEHAFGNWLATPSGSRLVNELQGMGGMKWFKDVEYYIGGWREVISLLEDYCNEPVALKTMRASLNQIDKVVEQMRNESPLPQDEPKDSQLKAVEEFVRRRIDIVESDDYSISREKFAAKHELYKVLGFVRNH